MRAVHENAERVSGQPNAGESPAESAGTGEQTGAPASTPELSRSAVEIEFVHVTKIYGKGSGRESPAALNDLSLVIPAGEICCLVGPSGGGKTTAMRLVNRLVDASDGDILVGGRSIYSIDPVTLRRDIGYAIQDVGLFPHLTVSGNIAVPLRLRGWRKPRINARVEELLTLVGLDRAAAKRYPAMLSGGQQQRVGLARALATDPPIMLMDEPFGALDPITRTRIQDEFLRLHAEIRKTVIFVTHDIDEALKMGDKVAVLRPGGLLAQYASPEELLAAPADDYVADFIGADRGLKRLALQTVGDLCTGDGDEPSEARLPAVAADTSLRVALSVLLETGRSAVVVVADDRRLGIVTLDQLIGLLPASRAQEHQPQ